MKRALLTGVLAAAAFVAGAAAQTPPAATARVQVEPGTQPVPPVTFRAEIDYVEVDAVVTDERGNLVKGLTQEDFDIYEDGKPQKVSFFSQVVIPVEKLERFMTDGKPLVPDVRSNAQPFSGRIYVLLLDDYHVGAIRSAQVKKAAHAFIDKYLGANDVAAVIHASGRLDASQEFTNDPRLLNAAIDKFIGQKLRSRTLERLDEYNRTSDLRQPTSSNDGTTGQGVTGADQKILDPLDAERGYYARATLGTLRNLADFMGSIRGRRKAILMFSEGIDYPIYDVFDSRDASTIVSDTRDAIAAASKANVNFYTIDPRGLHGMGDENMELGGFPVPKGKVVLMSPYVTHRDARWFREPLNFQPERWLTEEPARPKFAYFPFGGGARVCIGERFAWMEGVLLLAALGQKWTLDLAPGHPVATRALITLRPRHGMRMVASRRT